jgi:hypothetical protein
MKHCAKTDKPDIAMAPLTDEEACIICRLRAMRTSARKMIYDLSAEYAREFPEPEQYAALVT